MSEEQLQAQCSQWFWNTYPNLRRTMFHVQQSAWNRIQGSRFKAIGVVKGISDLVWVLPNRVAFIELKLDTGKQSAEQIDFERKVLERGHYYVIIRSFEEFKKYVTENI